MKDIRLGESLWSEWDGEGYETAESFNTVYYTIDHVDLSNDLVKRALASALQRDGISDSLGDGFRVVETCKISHGWAGYAEGEHVFSTCDDIGETFFGDFVDNVKQITWIEF